MTVTVWHDQLAHAPFDRVNSCALAAKSLRLLKLTTLACTRAANHADIVIGIAVLPDIAGSTAGKSAHLLCFLLVDPKQGPQVQEGVRRWGGLPLLSSHCNVLHGAVMNIALQAQLVAALSHLQNVHLIPAMLQNEKDDQSTEYIITIIHRCSS